MSDYDAIVLAGGKAARLGGVDKPSIDIAGRTMLDRVLDACADARVTVVVGGPRPTDRPVTWVQEDPPFGGPLAGLGAGLAALPTDAERVVALAADMPFLTAAAVDRLLDGLPGHDAALFVDHDGRVQPLAGAYLVSVLRDALGTYGELRDRSVMRMLDTMDVMTVPDDGATRDCDTDEQIEIARRMLRRT